MINAPSTETELLPLILGVLLIASSLAFTALALTLLLLDKKRCWDDSDEDSDEGSDEDSDQSVHHNSWVHGRPSSEDSELDAGGEEKALMSWSNLSCVFPSKKSKGQDITTLSRVSGKINYNELVAIMGPSGGGKSTLMDILSGRKSVGKLGGEISLLGESMMSGSPTCKEILKDVVAYVPQNEQFFPNQTPEEAVAFAANLKLGRDERGDNVRQQRIDQTLDIVGISKEARRRPIGGELAGGIVIRGLSGGERKRLALACAVAMKPSLLFLDEITSGLDSENAILVIELIKKMCVNMNVAACIVIHQPSYEVFSHFDRLILLSEGKCVYSDDIGSIRSLYKQIDRVMPPNYLIPNDIVKVARSGLMVAQPPSPLVETCGIKLLDAIENRERPSALFQLQVVIYRQLMNHYMRNITNLLARLFIYGLTSLLLGAVFWKIADTGDSDSLSFDQAQASFGAGIFLVQVFYLLPFAQISTFFFDKKLFASESSIGLYPAWIYSLSQLILELWVMVLCALVATSIVVPMVGLWNPSALSKEHSFVSMFTVFAVGGVVGNSLVMLTSICMFSQDLAFLVGAANVVVFLSLSGGFVPFPFIEGWISWLQWVSPIKYTFQAFTYSLLGDTAAESLLVALELDAPSSVSYNIAILIGFFVVCAVCSVAALSRQKEVR